MLSFKNSTKLPERPAQRLEAFGRALSRRPAWKTLLADAMHVPKRTMSYWLAGSPPKDLDERLRRLATEAIIEQARCADVMRNFRDQLEQGSV